MNHYILYTLEPISDNIFIQLSLSYLSEKLQSDVSGFYKYKFTLTSRNINGILKPVKGDDKCPFLIVSDKDLYGYCTSSTFVKGNKKYIYNSHYPITTNKQPYKQLKEHYKAYLTDRLMESL